MCPSPSPLLTLAVSSENFSTVTNNNSNCSSKNFRRANRKVQRKMKKNGGWNAGNRLDTSNSLITHSLPLSQRND